MDIDKRLQKAIKHFWKTRDSQSKSQGAKSGQRDAGARSAVTGGKQMNGFINLIRDLLIESGISRVLRCSAKKMSSYPATFDPKSAGICL